MEKSTRKNTLWELHAPEKSPKIYLITNCFGSKRNFLLTRVFFNFCQTQIKGCLLWCLCLTEKDCFWRVLYIVLRNQSKQTRMWKWHFKSHLKPPCRVSNIKGHSEGRCSWFEKSVFIRIAIYFPLLSSWCKWNYSGSMDILFFAWGIQVSLYKGQWMFPPAPSMGIPTSEVLVQKNW